MINFGNWPSESHDDVDQIKRIISGTEKKIKKGIVSINKEDPEIAIKGSAAEPYVATLEECTCMDFSVRQAPCKHMYCLADELGLLDEWKHLHYDSAIFDPKLTLDHYVRIYKGGQIKPEHYVKLHETLSKLK